MELVIVYAESAQDAHARKLADFLVKAGLQPEFQVVEPESEVEERLYDWGEDIDRLFPFVQIGEKPRINLFAPSTAILARVFPEGGEGEGEIPENAALTVYTGSLDQDCYRMEEHLRKIGANWKRVVLESTPGAATKVRKWSGGRWVVPSFQWGQKARMFNPGATVVGRLIGKA